MSFCAGNGAVFVSWATHNATIVKTKEEVEKPDLSGVASEVSQMHGLQA